MAYAEKRGKGPRPWRVKYKRPDGSEASEPGFETEAEALNWGRDQEALIRRGGWIDPRGGDILLKDWVDDHWWPTQDLALNTRVSYRRILKNYLIPRYGMRPLNTLTSYTEINTWELELKRTVPGYAAAARSLLSSILGDAVDEGLIGVNVGRRPSRKRGRKTKVAGREQEKLTITPLEALLLAERAALVTGRVQDFIMQIHLPYTGMRWAEVVGLEPKYLRPGLIRVDWQLYQVDGAFLKAQPKDASMRNVDIPPFLMKLLELLEPTPCKHKQWDPPKDADEHDVVCPGGVRYLYLGAKGAHIAGRDYGSKVYDPAGDAWWPNLQGKRGTRKRVLVDMAGGWPGLPVQAWPEAVAGREFVPPRGSGYRTVDLSAMAVATWLPLVPGVHAHAYKHTHRTWMDEDGVPEVLKHERLGHDFEGIRAVYSHVTASMRADLLMALEARWESSLRQRAALCPHSPLPVLDGLLEPYRRGVIPGAQKSISQFPPSSRG